MQEVLEEFASALGADLSEAERWRERLAPARAAAAEIDRLSWQEGRVHGLENHLWLVSASDFCADPPRYEREARAFIESARARSPLPCSLRLGLCGIPPIVPALYGFVEEFGALVVYNETQRQFAMTAGGPAACVRALDASPTAQPAAASEAPSSASAAKSQPPGGLAEQYTRYTYPYGVFPRAADVRAECERRQLDGLIHYVQSFCHRRIEDRIMRDSVSVPVLALEADRPGPLSGQMKTRLEAFLQMLAARKSGRQIL
jgi:benzoyl-CoA reductase/2-hydroxyglutaryl-CoA dehydratase subunit BcrC/BadD/HgdB